MVELIHQATMAVLSGLGSGAISGAAAEALQRFLRRIGLQPADSSDGATHPTFDEMRDAIAAGLDDGLLTTSDLKDLIALVGSTTSVAGNTGTTAAGGERSTNVVDQSQNTHVQGDQTINHVHGNQINIGNMHL